MSVIARFEVIPVGDEHMSRAIARALRALDQHPVSYQTTPTGTVIEADTVERIFAAVQDAHQAIPEDRVITSVQVDEDRRRPQHARQRVAAVERELGRPAQRGQQQGQSAGTTPPARAQSQRPPVQAQPRQTSARAQQGQPPAHTRPPAQTQPRQAPPGRGQSTGTAQTQ